MAGNLAFIALSCSEIYMSVYILYVLKARERSYDQSEHLEEGKEKERRKEIPRTPESPNAAASTLQLNAPLTNIICKLKIVSKCDIALCFLMYVCNM